MKILFWKTFTQSELYNALRSDHERERGQAYDYLYKNVYPLFSGWARKQGGTQEEMEDAFQDGLLSFMTDIRNGKYVLMEQARIESVVFNYTKRKFLNSVSRVHRNTGTSIESFYHLIDPNAQNPLAALEEKSVMWIVERCLEALGKKCREILTSFYIEELSLREMAELSGSTEGSMKVERFNCMKKLRTCVVSKMDR